MNKTLLMLSLSLCIAHPVQVFAKKRAKKQSQRIQRGVKSGSLTKDEAKELREDGREIRQEVKSARSDGQVDAAEKQKIKEMRKERSEKIFKEKTDDEYPISKPQMKRLKKAQRSGKITSEQMQELRVEMKQIKDKRKEFLKSDSLLDQKEKAELKAMSQSLREKMQKYKTQ